MKKITIFLLLFFITIIVQAQVGINTTIPNAQLDIRSSNQAVPTNTDGILIPKVDAFPATNPTAAQQGMLVYLTTAAGADLPGFYYWDNTTVDWKPIAGNSGVTLDQAYDFGGPGLGRTITADTGAVTINGTDGLVSNGTFGSGVMAPGGAGVKMFWNPRRAAFRAGEVDGIQWDFGNIGPNSAAFGYSTIASGSFSTAFGIGAIASGPTSIAFGSFSDATGSNSTAFGRSTIASGFISTAFGDSTTASGSFSTAFGVNTIANGSNSTAFGIRNTASSYAETVLGIGATPSFTSINGATQFRTANATDRLFVIGNAIDANNNNLVDNAERSDALIVLKNGLTRLPSTTNAMITAADGKAVVTKEYLQNTTSGTLDQAYDFGGAGLGRTITADTGAVTIDGTDGLVSTGTIGTGALAPTGAGVRMVWNPRKGAFRAGNAAGNEWDDANLGEYSAAFGVNPTASGNYSFAIGIGNTASGIGSFSAGFNAVSNADFSTTFGYETVASGDSALAFGSNTNASASNATAFGSFSTASGVNSTAFGNNTSASGEYATSFGITSLASGNTATSFGSFTSASGVLSTAFGELTSAAGARSTAFGLLSAANGYLSTAFGMQNNAPSYSETVIGIGATNYTPSPGGDLNFQPANATDRLFVIGNAIDTNNNNAVENSERSDAMIVLKNGLTRLPSTTNAMITTADGKAVVTKEYLQNNAWLLTGNAATGTEFLGTTTNFPLQFRVNNIRSGLLDIQNDNYVLGENALSQATPGIQTVAIGTNAGLNQQSSAFGNLFIGHQTGENNTTGVRNTFLGYRAGRANTIASNNTIIGFNSGVSSNSSGNSFYGFASGFSNTTGGLNTFIGSSSGVSNTTANLNTFIGALAGSDTTTGGNNTFLGHQAGLTNSTGFNNTFIGQLSGDTNLTGSNNSTLGTNADFGSNSLTNATALGASARVDANNSMVLGSIAGVNGAANSINVGIGTTTPLDRLHVVGNIRMVDGNQATGRVLTSDANGVATWQNASANAWGLLGNTGTNATTNFLGTTDNVDLVFRRFNIESGRIGDTNTFFGSGSGAVNTGLSNTFYGARSGLLNANGNFNTFIGRLAGSNGITGSTNTYVGYASGLNNTGLSNTIMGAFSGQNTSGNSNVFIGVNTGGSNTTGSNNTLIGNNSNVSIGNLSNATAIGNNSQVDTSNSLVLGSINGVNGSFVSTNVGIGTTSPLTRLEIVDENTPTSNLIYGNLHVRSNNAQNIDIGGAITLGGYNDDTMVQPRVFGSVEGRKSNATTNNSSGYLSFKTNNAGTLAERIRITNTGNVGVGIPIPLGLFEIALDQGRKPGTNTWTIVSDARLKTINGNYTKGLNEIIQLNPIRFNYRNSGERVFEKEVLDTEYPGFIAQEVQPLFPDAVGTDSDGFLNFNIHPILIASVNAIKELNAKNESLQTENESLKTELNQQKAQLELVMQRLSALEKK